MGTCLDVTRHGLVLELTDRPAIAAFETATRHSLPLADAAIYSMALQHGARCGRRMWTIRGCRASATAQRVELRSLNLNSTIISVKLKGAFTYGICPATMPYI